MPFFSSDHWIQYLISGHGLPAAANGFLTSAEYQKRALTRFT